MVYSFDDALQRPRPYILSKVHRVSYGLLCLGGSNFEKSWGSWAFRNPIESVTLARAAAAADPGKKQLNN